MPMTHDLSREDCSRLLTAGVAGRVALGTPTGPHIVPVNYAVDGEPGQSRSWSARRRTACSGPTAATPRSASRSTSSTTSSSAAGASSSAGARRFVDDHEELAEIARSWQPRPWAEGQRNLVVRIPWTEVTGRQLGGGWDPWQHLPVRRLA